MITKAYSKYFQKSKAFLFPLLGLPKFALTFEIETYLVLDNIVSLEDVNIVCKIKHNNSEDFFIYENIECKLNQL